MAAVRQSDPREYFMDNRVLSFQPRAKRLNHIKTIKKIVTVGFLAGYYDEDLYAGVFEYKYRVDELNTDTKKLEETSSFVRDGEFWDYIEDYKDWCLPYYGCLEDGLPFKQAHAKIKRMYDAWVESGKPTAEEMTQVKICKAIRRLKDKSASEFQNFVESFANFVQVMDSV
ncbi:hypothetical protein SLS56_002699 [Neofusicoccum ribis]|uniref:Uncharacterized protein n=1 Tax=Neofusicoccum ribis TaxID=45134 RepID=A0ABR3T2L9_9PEZI